MNLVIEKPDLSKTMHIDVTRTNILTASNQSFCLDANRPFPLILIRHLMLASHGARLPWERG